MGTERGWRLRERSLSQPRLCPARQAWRLRPPRSGVAIARTGASEPLGVVVLDAESGSRPRPTLVSSGAARSLESRLRLDLPAVARGAICAVGATEESLPEAIDLCRDSGAAAVVSNAEPTTWREILDGGAVGAAVLRADAKAARALTALAAAGADQAPAPRRASCRALQGLWRRGAPLPESSRAASLGCAPGASRGGCCGRKRDRRRPSPCSWRSR